MLLYSLSEASDQIFSYSRIKNWGIQMKTVVAVDYDLMSLDIVEELLGENGYQVISFSEAGKAIEYVQTADNPIDLFLIDIRMKDLAGIEMLKYLKYSDTRHNNSPVITTSSLTPKEFKDKALNLGATAYIAKPFSEGDLMQKIQNATKNLKGTS